MSREELLKVAEDALNDAELRSDEIPPIDLYVDQIINLINEKLEQGSERYRDRQLTKTMINNYSKDGLIAPIKGKKYNKEQILQMLTIYTLKSTISIGEIKRLLDGAYGTENFDGEALQRFYDKYLDVKSTDRRFALDALNGIIDRNGFDVDDDVDYISTVCAMVAFSAHIKNIAQAMIDARFPQPEDEPEDVDDTQRVSKKIEKIERKGERKGEKVGKKTERKIEKIELKGERKGEKVGKKTEKKIEKIKTKED